MYCPQISVLKGRTTVLIKKKFDILFKKNFFLTKKSENKTKIFKLILKQRRGEGVLNPLYFKPLLVF